MTHLAGDTQRDAELAAVHSEKVTWHLRAVANGLLPSLAWVADGSDTWPCHPGARLARLSARALLHWGSGTGCFSSANSGRPIAYLAQAASPYRGLHSLRAQRRHNRLLVLWTKMASTSRSPMLAYTRERLDPRCPDYPAICHSILHGIHDCLSEKYWGYSLYARF